MKKINFTNENKLSDVTIYFNYVVSFSCGTVKTGITAFPYHRLQDFMQEAARHGLSINGFYVRPSTSKRKALMIETKVCEKHKEDSIQGHREWFRQDCSWMVGLGQKRIKELKSYNNFFYFVCSSLESYWKYSSVGVLFSYKVSQLCENIENIGNSGRRFRIPSSIKSFSVVEA